MIDVAARCVALYCRRSVNGTPQIVVRNVVSDDGQTMTATSTVVNRGVNQVVVYEKQ